MAFPKTHRLIDPDVLLQVRTQPCCICGRRPSDASHIRTRGSGGPDTLWNVFPKCREHHTEWGKMGWSLFLKRYPIFQWRLQMAGWTWEDQKLWHPGLAA